MIECSVPKSRSGDLLLDNRIDANEVAFHANRLTTHNGILHFVLTYGQMSRSLKHRNYSWASPYVCHFYIFRQVDKRIERLTRKALGARFVSFDLVDVTGNGWKDVLIRTRTSPQRDDISFWAVDGQRGEVREVATPEGCSRFVQTYGVGVSLVKEVTRIVDENSRIEIQEDYKWNPRENRFDLYSQSRQRCSYLSSQR